MLKPNEDLIVGNWIFECGGTLADENCKRIEWLIKHCLAEVSRADGGWTTIYRNPADGCYWQLTYPHSEMAGGGPPTLKYVGASLS